MRRPDKLEILIWVGVALLVIGVIALAVVDCSKKAECRKKGGTVETYGCTTQVVCTTVNKIYTCTPQTVCKWRCVMPPRQTE